MRLVQYLSELRQDAAFSLRQMIATPGFSARRGRHARPRHRRDDRHLQRGERRRAAAAAGPRTRADRRGERGLARPGARQHVGRQLRRHRGGPADVFQSMTATTATSMTLARDEGAERVVGVRASAGFFDVFGVAPDARPRLHRGRGRAGPRPGRGPESPLLDAAVRRRPGHPRPADHARRAPLHGHRRHARVLRLHRRRGGAVDADRLHAGAEGDARRALPERLRAAAAWRHDRAGGAAARTRLPADCASDFRRTTPSASSSRRLADARPSSATPASGCYVLLGAVGVRAAHRVRQRLEPAAGARRRARARAGRPQRARRRAGTPRPPALHRKPGPRPRRRRRRRRACPGVHRGC